MSDTIITREFRIDDYEAAIELWKRVEGVEIAEGDSKEEIAQFLDGNAGLSRAAVDGPVLAGVSLCGHDGHRGHIYHLAVHADYQRLGLGRRLVDECLGGLRCAGIKRAIILVAGDNARGHSFWRRAGWEEIDGAVAMGIDLSAEENQGDTRHTR